VPVQTEGYLLHVRQESPESPNCHPAEDFDFHTWLAAAAHRRPGDPERGDRVHPRVRARHLTWTVQAPELLARHKTGAYRRLDHAGSKHPDEVGKSRGTIWEIHPVMQVETQQGNGWKER
jgi:hypothetical protein